ncbi:MAG: hypothetical protein C5B59_17410 [Bacteroidetes bacterium]|nr:MAG: hypothetical protein C5B59_17410 [Bacteroidota bacterium]
MSRSTLVSDTQYIVGVGGFPSIGYALDYVKNTVDMSGFNVTLNLTNSAYNECVRVNGPFVGGGTVRIIGQGATVWKPDASAWHLLEVNMARMEIGGIEFWGGTLDCLHISRASYVQLFSNRFGRTADYHIDVDTCATVVCSSNYDIIGGGRAHVAASLGGLFLGYAGVVTSHSPSFSNAFMQASENAVIQVIQPTYQGVVYGRKFDAHNGGGVATGRGANSVLPGSSYGTTQNGGWST